MKVILSENSSGQLKIILAEITTDVIFIKITMAGDRYDIINPVGSGGLGTVSKARDTQLNRLVAIKRLKRESDDGEADPEEEQKLLHEASITGALQHPNIVSVYDGGVDEEGAFLVMEYVDGDTLTEVFSTRNAHGF